MQTKKDTHLQHPDSGDWEKPMD